MVCLNFFFKGGGREGGRAKFSENKTRPQPENGELKKFGVARKQVPRIVY